MFLGATQELLAATYDELNKPADDEPAFELQQLGVTPYRSLRRQCCSILPHAIGSNLCRDSGV